MYSTTEEYLGALRKGDYLGALIWVDALAYRYHLPDGAADALLPVAIFDLIHHGFTVDDFYHVQLIYTLLCDQLPPFSEKVAYQATLFCSAALQYMVYAEHDLILFYLNDSLVQTDGVDKKQHENVQDILTWMQRSPIEFDFGKNSDALTEKYELLNANFPKLLMQAREIRKKINQVLTCQHLLDIYIVELTQHCQDNDFSAVRLGVIRAMSDYLKNRTLMTEDIEARLVGFVNKIRDMEPNPWEKTLLDKLLPQNAIEKAFVSRLFDKAAEKFQFFSVKVLSHLLPKVGATEVVSKPHP